MIKTLENIKLHSQKFVGVELHNFRWVVEEGHVNQFKNSLKVQGVDFISKDKMPIAYSITSSHWGTPHLEVLQKLGADIERIVHGEHAFKIYKSLEIGHAYRVSQKLDDLIEKRSKAYGSMLFFIIETSITDSSNFICLVQKHTSIQLGNNE